MTPPHHDPATLLVGVPTSPGVGFGPVVHPVPAPVAAAGAPDGGCRAHGVVVASDLGPGDVQALGGAAVQALATVGGAPLSHAAIIARSLGIPAVTGVGRGLLDVPAGTVVLVDGDAGTVRVAPTAAMVEEARARQAATRGRQDDARRMASGPALTRDGRAVPVLANVGSPEEAELAVREGADGVGMLRTEFAFLNRDGPPGEEEQYHAYRGVADALGDRPLVVRTLDLGADIPAWGGVAEPNPALGNRGIRLTLGAPELFASQLRAIARLAEERPVRVMFPMVTTVDELRRARACLDSVTAASSGKGAQGGALEVGITVEVPAAAITADAFAPVVDFFAIGTNDLTQYTLATDRANAAVAGLADGCHPAVLRLIRDVTAAARRHGRPVGVVGELASDPLGIPLLLGLDVATLSVRPNAVAAVKETVRAVRLDEARGLAEAALGAGSAAAVRELVAQRRAGVLEPG